MKYLKENYMHVSLNVTDRLRTLSNGAKALYLFLKIIEHKYIFDGTEFYHTDKQISDESGINIKMIQRSRKELIDAGLIKYRRGKVKRIDEVTYNKAVGIYEMINE